MKYTVAWEASAESHLIEIWCINPALRSDISPASDDIDCQLRDDPRTVGEQYSTHWRQVVRPPLAVLFPVNEADRLVNVAYVKFWDE
jgi:hypothetical protein